MFHHGFDMWFLCSLTSEGEKRWERGHKSVISVGEGAIVLLLRDASQNNMSGRIILKIRTGEMKKKRENKFLSDNELQGTFPIRTINNLHRTRTNKYSEIRRGWTPFKQGECMSWQSAKPEEGDPTFRMDLCCCWMNSSARNGRGTPSLMAEEHCGGTIGPWDGNGSRYLPCSPLILRGCIKQWV